MPSSTPSLPPIAAIPGHAAVAALRRLSPERAHAIAIAGLGLGLAGARRKPADPAIAVDVMGLSFANPIGLAAGFDKDGRVIRPLGRLGFGFVEAGTVTPLPQRGNPHPRLFRLDEDRAVINRMGFNNQGIDRLLSRLARLRRVPGVPLGINLGINKQGAVPLRDYPTLVRAVSRHADYLVINLSSPNTPGLRDLQAAASIATLLREVARANEAARPVLVKLAPDLAPESLAGIVEAAIDGGACGLIVSNTTLGRPASLRSPLAAESGGLSGRPLRAHSTSMLAQVARLSRGRLTLVGCGGIETASDVLEKIEAGADLVQIYTGFVLGGVPLLHRLLDDLPKRLSAAGLEHLSQAKGKAL